jgi:uncharacterized surface protein with fasciclin (FAS1) repeats
MTYVGPYSQATLFYQPDEIYNETNTTRVSEPGTILDYICKNFVGFLNVIKTANLTSLYDSNVKKYTVFVPSVSNTFPSFDGDMAYRMCRGSMVNGALPTSVLASSKFYLLQTLLPQTSIAVENFENVITINCKHKLLYGSIFCSNGIIHVIDGVLWPNY